MLQRLLLVSLLCCGPVLVNAADPVSRWDFSPEFSRAEQQQVKRWLGEVHEGLQKLYGPAPRPYEIHMKKRGSTRSPVPWAHTQKGRPLQVHFYVDTQAHSWSEFRADWTAAHELSHMLFPYVGVDRWFSEGLASYLQYQVMYAAGHISWPRAVARYAERFERVQRSRVPADWSVLEHNDRLREYRDFPRLYWGGAAFFALVDRALWQQQQMRFADVVTEYTRCCYRRGGVTAMQVLRQFDRISNTQLFARTYAEVMMTDGTPDTTGLAAWLAEHPPL